MQCPNWLQKMPVRSFYILWATIVHFRFVNNLIILVLFGGYFVLVGMIAIEGWGYQFFLAYFTMVTFIMFSFLDKSKKRNNWSLYWREINVWPCESMLLEGFCLKFLMDCHANGVGRIFNLKYWSPIQSIWMDFVCLFSSLDYLFE